MYPCHVCKRHIREQEPACPFCSADLRTSKIWAPVSLGAFAFAALAAFGSTACSKDTAPSDGETTETTTNATTVDDASESETVSTETDTDDGPDDTTATSGSFYAGPEVDFGPVSACDPFLQDCPDGEKCAPYASSGGPWNANKCVPVLGDGAASEPCTYGGSVEATDDCGPGLYCWNVMNVEGQQIGECTEFCQGTPDTPECDPGTSCLIAYDGSVTLCVATCNPLSQDCDPGLACYWVTDNFNCVSTTQDIPLGQPCGYINDCAAGTGCIPAELMPDCAGSKCCASFCDLESNEPCPQPGTECSGFFEEGTAPPGYENVGVCVLPGA